MSKVAKRARAKRKKTFRKVHTLLGFLVLIPLLNYTITGVLLMHKSDFGLDQKRVKSEWVMSQYGLTFEEEPEAWQFGSEELVAWEGEAVLDETLVEVEGEIVAMTGVDRGVCIATASKIYFYGKNRKLIETLESGLSLPEGEIVSISSMDGMLTVKYADKSVRFVDADLIEYVDFSPSGGKELRSGRKVELDEEQKMKFKQLIIGEGAPMDRVLLDLHSGHIFSWFGKVMADAFALGILGLTFSGVAIYVRKRRRAQRKENVDEPSEI